MHRARIHTKSASNDVVDYIIYKYAISIIPQLYGQRNWNIKYASIYVHGERYIETDNYFERTRPRPFAPVFIYYKEA